MNDRQILELALQKKWISHQDLLNILKLQESLLQTGAKGEEVSVEKLLLQKKLLPPAMIEKLVEESASGSSSLEKKSLTEKFHQLQQGGPSFEFAGYQVESFYKEGGMGFVFKARRRDTPRLYALKILKFSSSLQEARERFLREIRILSEIDESAHIVRILDWGEKEGIDFIAMDFLEGLPLGEAMERTSFSSSQWLELFLPLLHTIHQLHLQKIIHRDLKPENIILTPQNKLVLIDFGLGKIFGQKDKNVETKIIGTPLYMSPEQLRGKGQIDHLTDIWALGVILYQLLSGRHPFPHKNHRELTHSICYGKAVSLQEISPHLGEKLCSVIHKALMPGQMDRWQSVRELAQGLEEAKG